MNGVSMSNRPKLSARFLADANAWLENLHCRELTHEKAYSWPWERAELPGWTERYGSIWHDWDVAKEGPFAEKILVNAAIMRGIVDHPAPELFDLSKPVFEALAEVPIWFRVEYLFAAFAKERHNIVNRLGRDLLQEIESGSIAHDSLKMLVLEMVVFSLIRLNYKSFLDDPSILADKVGKFLNAPSLRQLTRQNTTSIAKARGCYHCFSGDLDKATKFMEDAYELDGFHSPIFQPVKTIVNMKKLVGLLEDQDFSAHLLDWFEEQAPLTPYFRHDGKEDHALLVSGDQRYFDLFGENFAEVTGLSNPGSLIHYHLVNFSKDRDLMPLFDEWEKRFSVRINFTHENNKMLAADPAMLRGASANTRFTSLPLYLGHYAGILVCDIDGWIDRPLDTVIDHSKADILVRSGVWSDFKGGWRVPWASVTASYMSFKSTAAARNAADWVAFYIKYLNFRTDGKVGVDRDLFWADQSGTFLVLRYLQEKGDVNIGSISRGFGQSNGLETDDRITGRRRGARAIIEKLKEKR